MKSLSRVQLLATSWTAAYQAPLSMGFSRPEYWRRLPFPLSGNLPDPGLEPVSPALAGGFFTTVPSGKPLNVIHELIHLAASGLVSRGISGCCPWTLWLWRTDSVVAVHGLCFSTACGVFVPQPGILPMSPALEGGFLTIGQSGNNYCPSFLRI